MGEINIENNKLSTQLISVPRNSNLGQLKNKENLVDRMKEKEIINRLYQNDKYQTRLALKKVKD